ncbi:MAG: hypothetical protein LC768_12880 [Acidobacteria bacterium]|nr:hypothetical protein [Acidobacteriota bacterium]MCA1639205.1 hypothetical protein [Acidobacteriota bacterium]
MKEDYLWDKTGKDSEIEKLENALQAFRFQGTAPPSLRAEVLPFRKEYSRKIFPIALAAAACLVFGMFALGIWLRVSGDKTEVKGDMAETIKTSGEEAVSVESGIEKANVLTVGKHKNITIKNVPTSAQITKRKVVALGKTVPVISRRREMIAKNDTVIKQNHKTVKQDDLLTKEEQHAYNQLMLALSITSSKLRLVKDKVEGMEE